MNGTLPGEGPAASGEGAAGEGTVGDGTRTTWYHCEYAWLGGPRATAGVNVEISGDRFTSVERGPAPPGSRHLAGLSLPGFANAHSHAFHRALRGRSEREGGSFWTWRAAMYEVAALLEPDSYLELARAVYAEMLLAGYTAVGEFHYLHHDPAGRPYADPNAMGHALIEAGRQAGIRLTLLDACYLQGGPGTPLEGTQRRFGDPGAAGWAERASSMGEVIGVARPGAAIHSLRAVPPGEAALVAEVAGERHWPLHVHLSEQPGENSAVLAAYGATPAALLEQAGALRASSVAVHATHLEEADRSRLACSGAAVCMCPTTERDLGDGIGPAHDLARLGSPLCIGSDSQAVIDPFEELRALELDERLSSGARGRFAVEELLVAGTSAGQRAIGWAEAGAIAPGKLADLVALSLDSPRLAGVSAGSLLEHAVFAAGAADVTDVLVSGRHVVAGGRHGAIEVAPSLRTAITALLGSA